MMEYVTFDVFQKHKEVSCAISTKSFGSMKKDDGSIHHASLLKFVKHVMPDALCVSMHQIHSNKVQIVEDNRELVIQDTDGLITNKKNLAVAVLVADCLPIFFYDPSKKVIGVTHAGSKGLLSGVIQATLMKMQEAFAVRPKDVLVGIGPGIETNCYEVNREYAALFEETYPNFQNIIIEKNNTYYIDLKKTAVQILLDQGILPKHLEVKSICTKCDSRQFYSYRNGDKNGRFAGIISLV